MKTIDLTPATDTPAEWAPKAVLAVVVSQAQEGATLDEVRRRMRVLDYLDSPADVLELEDADHATLAGCVRGFKFGQANRFILAACDAVEAAV